MRADGIVVDVVADSPSAVDLLPDGLDPYDVHDLGDGLTEVGHGLAELLGDLLGEVGQDALYDIELLVRLALLVHLVEMALEIPGT